MKLFMIFAGVIFLVSILSLAFTEVVGTTDYGVIQNNQSIVTDIWTPLDSIANHEKELTPKPSFDDLKSISDKNNASEIACIKKLRDYTMHNYPSGKNKDFKKIEDIYGMTEYDTKGVFCNSYNISAENQEMVDNITSNIFYLGHQYKKIEHSMICKNTIEKTFCKSIETFPHSQIKEADFLRGWILNLDIGRQCQYTLFILCNNLITHYNKLQRENNEIIDICRVNTSVNSLISSVDNLYKKNSELIILLNQFTKVNRTIIEQEKYKNFWNM